MTFVVLALFGSTLVGIVRVVIALVGIGTCTRRNAQRYRRTDERTGKRHDDANGRSYCVVVRSAKNRFWQHARIGLSSFTFAKSCRPVL